jgi:hypothetical protein
MTKASISRKRRVSAADAEFLRERANTIRVLGKRAAADVIEIGKLLQECKDRILRGGWLPWLKTEFKWSADTATRLMRVYAMVKSRNLRNRADMTIDISALYLLAEPSTPEPVRDQFLSLAAAGEPVKRADVQKELPPSYRLNWSERFGREPLKSASIRVTASSNGPRVTYRPRELSGKDLEIARLNTAARQLLHSETATAHWVDVFDDVRSARNKVLAKLVRLEEPEPDPADDKVVPFQPRSSPPDEK